MLRDRSARILWRYLLLWISFSGCTADKGADTASDTTSDAGGDSAIFSDTDPAPRETAVCAFGIPYYTRLGEGLDFLEAEDPINSDCRFAFHFAERLSDDTVAQIAEAGDTPKIYDIPGFMVATVDFACDANSSRRCTADEGEISLVTFEITSDDLENGTVSGRAVRIDIDARSTTPGNRARFQGTVEGTIP